MPKVDLWRPVDHFGFWIATWWTPVRQVRTGVLSFLSGLLLGLAVFVSNEPLFIFLMSAYALVLGGLGIVITAVLALKEDPDSSEEDLRPNV